METLNQQPENHQLVLLGGFAILSIAYFIGKLIHTLYFDPLSKIPGPKINAISRIPYARHLMKGTTVDNVVQLHEKYGEIVRLSPNEVSFVSGETAWQDIYGFRTGKHKGRLSMQKDPAWYPAPQNGILSILLANDEKHSSGRRLLSHAFSAHALAEQEPLIQQYIDQLIDRLKETAAESDKLQDMTQWYNWTTFDIIADLLFGEPFGSLQNRATHKYIQLLFDSMNGSRFNYMKIYFPFTKYLGSLIIDQSLNERRMEFFRWVHTQVEKRIQTDRQRPDFMTHILAHNGEKTELSRDELDSNANLMLIAGSETTATLLSAATYCILSNTDKLEKLKQEVRGLWKSYDEITMSAVNNAPYLLAVLNESLRFFPPVPTGFQRTVSAGGEVVSGYYLPEGTAVCMSHYPAYHSEAHFKHADQFIPERWMGDAEFADDKVNVFQPFSFGPRNCLGKNLAYAEMRLIFAKMIWSFDMELDPSCLDWVQRCKVITLWAKPPLLVKVKEVQR